MVERELVKKIVEANNVVKAFGEVHAVDGLSFFVEPGEIFGLLGPNGPVARCNCPILITGVLGNQENDTFTLTFIFENRYMNQTRIIQTFNIDL